MYVCTETYHGILIPTTHAYMVVQMRCRGWKKKNFSGGL